jgi:streptogrisin C
VGVLVHALIVRISRRVIMTPQKLGIVCAGILVVGLSTPAAASPNEPSTASVRVSIGGDAIGQEEDPNAQDFLGQAELAETYAIEARTAWQNEANEAAYELSQEYPGDYAGSILTETSFSISFKAQAPAGAASIMDEVDTPHTVVENVGVSEIEMTDLTQSTHRLIVASLPEMTTVATGYSLENRTLNVTVTPNSTALQRGGTALDPAQLSADLNALVGDSDLRGFDIAVTVDPDDAATDAGYGPAGGTKITGSDGYCTSGFVVKKIGSSELGVVTAGHCPNTLSQNAAGGYIAFNFRAEHIGTSGDIQWMRSPAMMDGWFHHDRGLGTAVTGQGIAGIGTTLCKFGEKTGRTCGTVQERGTSLTTQSGTSDNLVRTTGMTVDTGDSGGPVFKGGYAYGLVKGFQGGNYYYTPVGAALNKFGLNLCFNAC